MKIKKVYAVAFIKTKKVYAVAFIKTKKVYTVLKNKWKLTKGVLTPPLLQKVTLHSILRPVRSSNE